MSLRNQVMSGLRWSMAGRLMSQLISWGLTLVVFRLLQPSDYGLLSMATLIVGFLQLMAEVGLGVAVVQARTIETPQLRQIYGVVLLINSTLFATLFLVAPLVADFFTEPKLVSVVQCLALQFIALAFTVIPKALLERAMDFKKTSLIELVVTVLGGVLTLFLAYHGSGVWALVWGTLLTVFGRALVLNVVAPFAYWPSFSMTGMRRYLFFGGNVTADRMLWFFYSQADTLLVGKLLGKDALGIYSVSMHLATLPVQRIAGIINQVAMPAFAKVQHEQDLAASHFLKAVRLMCVVVCPVMFGMSSVAPELIQLVLGKHWNEAILPFQLLTLMMPIRMVAGLIPPVAHGMGRPDISLKNLMLASVVMPLAFYIASRWGLVGMSAAWVACFPLIFISNLRRAMPLLGLPVTAVLRAMLKPALCAAIMFLAVIFAKLAIPLPVHASLLLPLLIALGVLVYLAATWLLNRSAIDEALRLLRKPA